MADIIKTNPKSHKTNHKHAIKNIGPKILKVAGTIFSRVARTERKVGSNNALLKKMKKEIKKQQTAILKEIAKLKKEIINGKK